jgi:YARHG domain
MSEPISASAKFCPQCGGAADIDARFCKHCAFELSKTVQDPDATVVTAKSPQKAKPKSMLLIAGVAVGGLLVLGLIGTYLYKRNRTQANVSASSPTPATPTMSDKAKHVEEKILRNETLSDSDIAGLSAYELRVLRNMHFARYGRKYDQEGQLGGYFYTRPWYKPSDSYNENVITATDRANINLIVAAERLVSPPDTASVSSTPLITSSQPISTPEVSKTELTRQTVLSLAQSQIRKEVVANLDDCSNCGIGNVTDVYAAMMRDKIITCRTYGNSCLCWEACTPAQNGRGLRKVARGMDMTLGTLVPNDVTGISRINPNTAYADVILNFQPRDQEYRLFNKYKGAFSSRFGSSETHRVFLRLYDDGWRLESWQ